MATFPLLIPSAAPITPGAWPVTATSSLNGAESRIRHGSAQIGRRLRLTFTNVTEANFLAILAHYRGQRSGFDPFGFNTVTLAANLTPSGHAWLYASRPQVVDEHFNVFTVVCEFKAEPRGLVVAMGAVWRSAQTSLTRNVAPGKAFLTSSTTFLPGTGARFAAGVRWVTESTTFTPQGTSSGRSLVTGSTTLTPGTRVVVADGATYTITGGTSMAWSSSRKAYGWTFTLSADKVIKGVGFYDAGSNGLNGEYGFALLNGSVDINNPSSAVNFDENGDYPVMYVPSGTTATLSGPWRRVDLSATGTTLYAGNTYTLYCEPNDQSAVDSMLKNADGVSIAPGVSYGQNYAWNTSYSAATTTGDGIAYFGPMIFFE